MKRLKKSHLSPFETYLYIFFGIIALITIYPFYNVVIISFSNTVTSATYSPYLIPHVIDFTGYKTILEDINFYKSFATTLFVMIVGVSLNMTFSVVAAYVLSRKKLAGRNFFISAILFTMLFSGGLIPTYLVVSDLGLINSVWAMILPSLVSTYYLIIMKNYFVSLPVSLEEAARIDGANHMVILVKIYLPISKPFLATFALFYAVERWNEWWNAFLYIKEKGISPLQIYLRNVLINYSNTLNFQAQSVLSQQNKIFIQSVQMATIVIATFPILCAYPFLQKYFVKGVMVGSIKE